MEAHVFFHLIKEGPFCFLNTIVIAILWNLFLFSLFAEFFWLTRLELSVILTGRLCVFPSQDYVTYSQTSAGSMASKGYLKLDSDNDLHLHNADTLHGHLSVRYWSVIPAVQLYQITKFQWICMFVCFSFTARNAQEMPSGSNVLVSNTDLKLSDDHWMTFLPDGNTKTQPERCI